MLIRLKEKHTAILMFGAHLEVASQFPLQHGWSQSRTTHCMASYNTRTSCPGKQTNKQGELHNVTEVDIFSFSFPSLLSLQFM